MPVIAPIAVGAATKLYGAYNADKQQKKSERALRELRNKPMARFQVDPKIAAMYQQAAGEASTPRGFGGSAESGFRNQLARSMRGRFANAMSMSGGSGARGINAVLAGQEADALTNFATADENIRRGNRNASLSRMGQFAGQYQRTADQNTSNDINYRMQLERALGEGVSSQRDYKQNMFNSLGSDLITAGIYGMGDTGVDKTVDFTDTPTPTPTSTNFNQYKGTLLKPTYRLGDYEKAARASRYGRFARAGAYSENGIPDLGFEEETFGVNDPRFKLRR